MIRTPFVTRTALALALAAGAMGGLAVTTTPALAAKKDAAPAGPKLNLTKPYQAAAAPLVTEWAATKARPDVANAAAALKIAADETNAATTDAAQKAAEAKFVSAQNALTALIQPQIDKFQALMPLVTNQDEKFHAGSLGIDIGLFTMSQPLQRQTLQLQLDSGKVSPEKVPVYNFYVGKFAYSGKDFPAARAGFERAIQGGYHDGDVHRLLAETYFGENNARAGMESLRKSMDILRAAKRPVPLAMYQRGLEVANAAVVPDQQAWFASELVVAQPTTANWTRAIYTLRRINRYGDEEALDVMRLIDRTNSYANSSDFAEYMDLGVRIGLPKEVQSAAAKAVASGKMGASDRAITESRALAATRLKNDTAEGLVKGYERDSALPTATARTLQGAGDTFLTYGEYAKAEAAYARAAAMPGVDTGRILTRLGISQYDQGKYAEAQATFAKVTGPRAGLAQLWSAAARIKANAAAPAAPAAPAA